MPWNVRLEDGDCNLLEEIVGVWRFINPDSIRTLRILRFLDPYGDTVFNRLQMEPFLKDWEQLEGQASFAGEQSLWAEVKRLGRRCQSEPGLYLRFIGD
jgi:hypothetical protein